MIDWPNGVLLHNYFLKLVGIRQKPNMYLTIERSMKEKTESTANYASII